MAFNALKEKALSLPLSPGVYLMKDKTGGVIYIGKAKKLKNRVSQYFQDTVTHSPKTRVMVSKIDDFDVIVAASEFEALVLECSLIKHYLPQYNILLKDDKGYPYLRVNFKDAYPMISMVNKPLNDGAQYFGPFGSRAITGEILESIRSVFKLPNCNKNFAKDRGKCRPCLNYHINQCAGWCQLNKTADEYRNAIDQACQLLRGDYKTVAETVKEQMIDASDALNFELAASLRDRLNAIEALSRKQIVTAGASVDIDAIGYAQSETKACFAVLHFYDGKLLDKDYEIFPVPDDREGFLSSVVKQYYLNRGFTPKVILLPFDIDDRGLFEQLLEHNYNKKIKIKIPQRGDNVRLVMLAEKNAQEEVERVTDVDERISASLISLGKMLAINPPRRIESYDISNISGTDIVGAMVVFADGRPKRSEYKRFMIKHLKDQDDYASMHQVIMRRFDHYKKGDTGFDVMPDVLFIDGGEKHARTVEDALFKLDLQIPVFGMVKDDRHRTRALVTSDGKQINIDNQQSVFSMIGVIQEETHRFAISYHRKLRSKRLRYSTLDAIQGVGTVRKQQLLKRFKSISAISNASLAELKQVLPINAANAVYQYFHNEKGGEEQ